MPRCSETGCTKLASRKGLCQKHYMQQYRAKQKEPVTIPSPTVETYTPEFATVPKWAAAHVDYLLAGPYLVQPQFLTWTDTCIRLEYPPDFQHGPTRILSSAKPDTWVREKLTAYGWKYSGIDRAWRLWEGSLVAEPTTTPEPVTAPEPAPEPPTNGQPDMAGQLSTAVTGAIADVLGNFQSVSPELLKRLDGLESEVARLNESRPQELTVKVADVITQLPAEYRHKIFERVLTYAANRKHVFLVGPSGSGKTHMCKQIAAALDLSFHHTGAIQIKYELLGYQTADGTYIRTPLREAVEHGGVFLWDEIDGSDPNALVAFNAMLDNGLASFPDGPVEVHADFWAVGAGNTYGRGADRVYCGRNQLDGSSLERFRVLEIDYDLDLEWAVAGPTNSREEEWINTVRGWRSACDKLSVRHIISPRASIHGIEDLRMGMSLKEVAFSNVWKGLEDSQIRKIKAESRNSEGSE